MGVAGYNTTMTFDDDGGGGHQTLGATNLDLASAFDTADITETDEAGQNIIVTVQRTTITGTVIVEATGDDTPKDDFEVAHNSGTQCEVIFYPTGNNSGDRTYTMDALITQFNVTNNGPAGAVSANFTLELTGGSKVAISTV